MRFGFTEISIFYEFKLKTLIPYKALTIQSTILKI
jgi:hypothetical protein